MSILVGEDRPARDYPTLYFRLCGCAGPQPSRDNPRADEHARSCPYRLEVERDAEGRSRCDRGGE